MRFVVRKVKIAGKSTGTELEPPRPANSVLKAVEEYEAKESLEAICAGDADKLKCLFRRSRIGTSASSESKVGSTRRGRR